MDEVTIYEEDYIKEFPKLKSVINIHLNLNDGKTLLRHIPINGLVVRCNWDDDVITMLIRSLAVTWTKKIKYLRIMKNNVMYCVIYNDKITIKHVSFRKLSLQSTIENYYEKISGDDNLFWTELPKQILDVNRQQHLELNNLHYDTFVMLSLDIAFEDPPSRKMFGYRYRIVTPLWLTYYILTRDNITIVKGDIMLFRLNRTDKRYIRFHGFENGLTLGNVYSTVLSILSKCNACINHCDTVYRSLIAVETLYMGKLIKCH